MTRQRLLDAAAEAFAREGYDRANINRISTAAGLAKGTVYNYFPSKQALALALIDASADAHWAYLAAAVRAEGSAERRLARFFEAGFAFVAEHPAQMRFVINIIYGPHAEFRAHLYQAYQPIFVLVAGEIVAAGIAQGAFAAADPAAMAHMVMTVYLGTASQIREDSGFWLDPAQVAGFVQRALHT
jgi:AcrR family transcriptional regulator